MRPVFLAVAVLIGFLTWRANLQHPAFQSMMDGGIQGLAGNLRDGTVTFFKQAFATRVSILATLGTLLLASTFFIHFVAVAPPGRHFAFVVGSCLIAVGGVAPLFCAIFPPSLRRAGRAPSAPSRNVQLWIYLFVSSCGWMWLSQNLSHSAWPSVFFVTLNSYFILLRAPRALTPASLYSFVAGVALMALVSHSQLVVYTVRMLLFSPHFLRELTQNQSVISLAFDYLGVLLTALLFIALDSEVPSSLRLVFFPLTLLVAPVFFPLYLMAREQHPTKTKQS